MTTISSRAIGLALTGLMALSANAGAQTPTPPANPWDHGTKLSVMAGGAFSEPDPRGTLGMSIGWEITHRVELEGTGTWVVAQQSDEAFAAELKVSANLTRPGAVVPFVAGGVGMYRASFDTTRSTLPEFYQRRVAPSSVDTLVDFTDPSYVIAGGVNIFTGTHVSIRPDVSVRLVTRGEGTFVVPMATIYFSYHFENHHVAEHRR